jgi:hypothetical protein
MYVGDVGVGDFSTHRNFGCSFEDLFQIFRKDGRKISA